MLLLLLLLLLLLRQSGPIWVLDKVRFFGSEALLRRAHRRVRPLHAVNRLGHLVPQLLCGVGPHPPPITARRHMTPGKRHGQSAADLGKQCACVGVLCWAMLEVLMRTSSVRRLSALGDNEDVQPHT